MHKGRCYPACPEGSTAANSTMECSSSGKERVPEAEGPGPRAESWMEVIEVDGTG